MENKKLSVIIPVYKAEKIISKNLKTVRDKISKYFSNYEIRAVIDGFLDNSFNEAKKVKTIPISNRVLPCRRAT